ncbi:SDR family oxidoreductase [Butyricimonas virosa]|uniref:SDR family oxidoreductase n=1 Tax=Butyricimonas virosa TaxID=544645 RepID=UPI00242E1078|nr:sugar nucleotide-binding protein [Butyricimonas virosa]MDY5532543.1 sugar nucleotide-binding protein [Butyricimonas virosa]
MKFLILGCNGMAGHTIALYLKEQGHDVCGFAKIKSQYIDSIVGDARDSDFLKKIIVKGEYDSIINCIGILNQFAEQNKSLATFLNSYFPHFLAEITSELDTQVIHMSTDCVFSGKRGGYTEYDFRDGETFYDRSKALGELEDKKNVTLRNSIVGPDINPKGIGLLNWFLQQKGEVNGFTKAMWTGQTTLQLAKTMEIAAKERVCGLYNAVPNHSISKYELLVLFNHFLRGDSLKINPVEGINADKSLKRTKYEFNYLIPDYEVMIKELAEWMIDHKKMYPHYNL